MPLGFFQPRRKPQDWIESRVLNEIPKETPKGAS
jgi:hypothetical protein